MEKFILKMKSKYPAFNFKLESKPRRRMVAIIVTLGAIGKAEIKTESFEDEKNWGIIGKAMIEKTIVDLQDLLGELKEDLSKTIQEASKSTELSI